MPPISFYPRRACFRGCRGLYSRPALSHFSFPEFCSLRRVSWPVRPLILSVGAVSFFTSTAFLPLLVPYCGLDFLPRFPLPLSLLSSSSTVYFSRNVQVDTNATLVPPYPMISFYTVLPADRASDFHFHLLTIARNDFPPPFFYTPERGGVFPDQQFILLIFSPLLIEWLPKLFRFPQSPLEVAPVSPFSPCETALLALLIVGALPQAILPFFQFPHVDDPVRFDLPALISILTAAVHFYFRLLLVTLDWPASLYLDRLPLPCKPFLFLCTLVPFPVRTETCCPSPQLRSEFENASS